MEIHLIYNLAISNLACKHSSIHSWS